ncbi:MAG TPA: hypothetical protein DCM15_03445 [Cryomorphaceae bacterium]|nr:hypothetical protein [Cryomorphaceae bacterium]|tara:strand:- start:1179 stop:2135 length:957 start_codon:yes stop_codon:yes gene_type:complete
MRKIILIFFAFIFSVALFSQSTKELVLTIDHTIASAPLTSSSIGVNNLGNQFNFSRLEYYMGDIQVIYDNDSVFNYPEVVLIDALDAATTNLYLGSQSLDSVTAVRFAIGVGTSLNHLDPSIYSSQSPLAPKSPSMHWGWSAGYRFIAAEGMGSSSLNQGFELHGLGDVNYAMQTISTSGVAVGTDTLEIKLVANYDALTQGIAVGQGVISHGESGSARQSLVNMNNHVFSSSEGNAALSDKELEHLDFVIYPNPANGSFWLTVPLGSQIEVINVLGQKIEHRTAEQTKERFVMNKTGVYIVILRQGKSVSTERVIIR